MNNRGKVINRWKLDPEAFSYILIFGSQVGDILWGGEGKTDIHRKGLYLPCKPQSHLRTLQPYQAPPLSLEWEPDWQVGGSLEASEISNQPAFQSSRMFSMLWPTQISGLAYLLISTFSYMNRLARIMNSGSHTTYPVLQSPDQSQWVRWKEPSSAAWGTGAWGGGWWCCRLLLAVSTSICNGLKYSGLWWLMPAWHLPN